MQAVAALRSPQRPHGRPRSRPRSQRPRPPPRPASQGTQPRRLPSTPAPSPSGTRPRRPSSRQPGRTQLQPAAARSHHMSHNKEGPRPSKRAAKSGREGHALNFYKIDRRTTGASKLRSHSSSSGHKLPEG